MCVSLIKRRPRQRYKKVERSKRCRLHHLSEITPVTAADTPLSPSPPITLQRITDIFITSLTERASRESGSTPSDGARWLHGVRNGLSHHICYLLLISCHVIIQKCKLTAAKLSRKLTGPRSVGCGCSPCPADRRSCSL